jgi:hypothetical protein
MQHIIHFFFSIFLYLFIYFFFFVFRIHTYYPQQKRDDYNWSIAVVVIDIVTRLTFFYFLSFLPLLFFFKLFQGKLITFIFQWIESSFRKTTAINQLIVTVVKSDTGKVEQNKRMFVLSFTILLDCYIYILIVSDLSIRWSFVM